VETIGKYQVHKVLGHGGMGTVYEALDPVIQRKVALKTMIPGLADAPELRLRFLREAQAAGGLRHRNIVTVYDLGEDKGRPYIAMEYIDGTDLEKIIQNKEPLSLEWKLDVLRQVCEGLGYAHRHGIVHRDIKPANIRVTPDGEVKIMDFGIAHLQSSNLTKSGLVLGTVHYMSPEQIDGAKVDHRADVFSVGAIAYELFAYKRPFEAESITGVMYQIMHDRPDEKVLPTTQYSPGLERIILKAMARQVEERYQSLEEMHTDLVSLVRDTVGKLDTRTPVPPVDDQADTLALQIDVEMEKRRATLKGLVGGGRQALTGGDLVRAREQATRALELFPEDAEAKALMSEVEAEALRRRVDRELTEIRGEIEAARDSGQLQRALSLCKRVLEVNPDDVGVARVAGEIEASIHERQVDELAEQARSYAASGDVELAQKIASRIQKLAPQSPRYLELQERLDFQAGRQRVMELTRLAQEHIAQGSLVEALASAEAALALDGSYALAREIRDRTTEILARQGKAPSPPRSGPQEQAAAPAAASAPPPARPAAPKSQPPAPKVAAARPAPAEGAAPRPARPAAAAPRSGPDNRPAVAPASRASALATPPPAAPTPTNAPSRAAPPPPVAAAAATPTPVPAPAAKPPSSAAPPAPPPAASPAPQDPLPLTPLPEGVPANAEAARLLETARRLLRDRAPQKALPVLEQAAALEPAHAGIERLLHLTRVEARKAEAEALTSAALNHFLQNNYKKARVAVEKALALEPGNKKARELINILGALG
jgi:tetratricopeptide (TPR) repeat protein/predicted Ser/Thr protein kinase